jgi:hypothetical protein
MTRIELLWPDGTVTTGATWTEVEDAVRAAQWRPFKSRREFRREMRRRALVWSGEKPKAARGTPRQFLQSLADAGMFMINIEKES